MFIVIKLEIQLAFILVDNLLFRSDDSLIFFLFSCLPEILPIRQLFVFGKFFFID